MIRQPPRSTRTEHTLSLHDVLPILTLRAETDGGDLTLKLWKSRDRSESQPQDSVGGVSNNGWLEPDDDPFTFYSNRYPRRSIDLFGVGATLAQDLSDALHLDLVIGHETSDRNLDGAPGAPIRSAERRVGKEWVSACRTRRSPYN